MHLDRRSDGKSGNFEAHESIIVRFNMSLETNRFTLFGELRLFEYIARTVSFFFQPFLGGDDCCIVIHTLIFVLRFFGFFRFGRSVRCHLKRHKSCYTGHLHRHRLCTTGPCHRLCVRLGFATVP